MKNLIITGSPRKNGNTGRMAEYLAGRLLGETEILSLDRRTDIVPCRDCRYCFSHPECAIQDGMQEIYEKLDQADRIIFAAPVYFYNIPGSMKAVLDRLQVYWAAVLRGGKKEPWRKGAVLLAGGAPESPRQFDGAVQTFQYMLDDLGAACQGIVAMGNSDRKGFEERPDIRERLDELAKKLNA